VILPTDLSADVEVAELGGCCQGRDICYCQLGRLSARQARMASSRAGPRAEGLRGCSTQISRASCWPATSLQHLTRSSVKPVRTAIYGRVQGTCKTQVKVLQCCEPLTMCRRRRHTGGNKKVKKRCKS